MKSLHKRAVLPSETLPFNLANKKKRAHDIFPSDVVYGSSHLAFGKNFENLLATRDFDLRDGTLCGYPSIGMRHPFRSDVSDRAVLLLEVEEKQDFERSASLLEVPPINMFQSPLDKGLMGSGQFVSFFNQLPSAELNVLSQRDLIGNQSILNFNMSSQSLTAFMASDSHSRKPISNGVLRNARSASLTERSVAGGSSSSARQGKRLQGSGNSDRMRLGHTSDRNIEKYFKSRCDKISEPVHPSGFSPPLFAHSKVLPVDNHKSSQLRSTPVRGLHAESKLDPERGIKERSLQLACSTSSSIMERNDKISKVESCLNFLKQFGLFKRTEEHVSRTDSDAAPRPGIVGDGVLSRNCRICSRPEDAVSTLICDACEQVFHLACCQPKLRTLPRDDIWTCSLCKRKDKRTKKKGSKSLESWLSGSHLSPSGWDLFQVGEKYRTQVRIGVKFQVEVPEWTGKEGQLLVEDIEDYFGSEEPLSLEEKIREKELAERNLANDIWPKGWLPAVSLPVGSRENWLQCQQVLYEEGEVCPDGTVAASDIICGKWRRAPLEVKAVEVGIVLALLCGILIMLIVLCHRSFPPKR